MNVCNSHGLYDAIIYVYNNGLQDFVTPVEELMTILADAIKNQQQVDHSILLAFVLTSRSLFPNQASLEEQQLVAPFRNPMEDVL